MWAIEISNPNWGRVYLGRSGFVCDIAAARTFHGSGNRSDAIRMVLGNCHREDRVRWVAL